jgi:ankyrin repeat protein
LGGFFYKIILLRFLSSHFVELVNVGDNFGRTPLHYAALRDDGGDLYNVLIGNGASDTAQDSVRKNPETVL